MSAIQGILMYTSNGSSIRMASCMSIIKRVSAIQGCPLEGVLLYVAFYILYNTNKITV